MSSISRKRMRHHLHLELLERRLLLSAGDSILALGPGDYAFLADADTTDLDYSKDFSLECIVDIQPHTPGGRWAGFVTKTSRYGLYNGAYSGWGMGTNQGDYDEFGQMLCAKVGDGTNQVAVSSRPANGQIYAVMTWDVSEKELRFFINGLEEGSDTNTSIVAADIENSENLQIGKSLNCLERNIFLARLWNRELSSAEVETLWDELDVSDGDGTGSHSLPPGLSTAGLFSEWRMDTESDAGGAAGTTHFKDSAGSNHLEMIGGADIIVASGSLALDFPADAGVQVDKNPTLTASGGRGEFATVTGPLHYYFQVDTTDQFNSAELVESDWITHYAEFTPILKPSTNYYWRAKVMDSSSTPQQSGYTSVQSFTTEASESWYVRPEGGSYGDEDGTSYENAWDGFLAIEWGAAGVEAGDTLYVCGTHVWEKTTSNFWAIAAREQIAASGYSDDYPITIRMDYATDEGVVWAAYYDSFEESLWTWDATYGAYYTAPTTNGIRTSRTYLFEDCDQGHDGMILLKKSLGTGENPSDLAPGEFCAYDPGAGELVYLKPNNAGSPDGRIFLSGYGYKFTLGRAKYITFKNCNFYDTRFEAEKDEVSITDIGVSTHLTWDGTTIKYNSSIVIEPREGHHYWTVENCTIEYARSAVYTVTSPGTQADNLTVRNCTIKHMGYGPWHNMDAHAIGLQGGDDILVEGNYIEDVGTAICMWTGSSRTSINNIIRYNFVKDTNKIDGGMGVGINPSQHWEGTNTQEHGHMTGLEIHHNILVDIEGGGITPGWPDESQIYSNLVFNSEEGIRAWAKWLGPYWQGRNNIVQDSIQRLVFFSNGHGTSDWTLDWDYNLYYPPTIPGSGGSDFYHRDYGYLDFTEWRTQTGRDANGMTVEPKYQNSSPDEPWEFKPVWDSPVIDAGDPTDMTYTLDFDGNPIYGVPDIGPFEYQPPYLIGVDEVGSSSNIRLYGDGKYRYLSAAGATGAAFDIAPAGDWPTFAPDEPRPFWMDIDFQSWDLGGSAYLKWIEDSSALGTDATVHSISGFTADTYYGVRVDGVLGAGISGAACNGGICLADAQGTITFTYSGAGGYTQTVFEVGPTFTLTDVPVINEGTYWQSGHSQIRTITYEFTANVSASLADFTLRNRDSAHVVDLSSRTVEVSGTSITVHLDRYGDDGAPQLFLQDANYELVLSGDITDVAGNPLDADGDGAPDESVKFCFYKLLGDFSSDRYVNSTDFLIWRVSYEMVPDGEMPVDPGYADPMFDVNGDAYINSSDFLHWRQCYEHSLTAMTDGLEVVASKATPPAGELVAGIPLQALKRPERPSLSELNKTMLNPGLLRAESAFALEAQISPEYTHRLTGMSSSSAHVAARYESRLPHWSASAQTGFLLRVPLNGQADSEPVVPLDRPILDAPLARIEIR